MAFIRLPGLAINPAHIAWVEELDEVESIVVHMGVAAVHHPSHGSFTSDPAPPPVSTHPVIELTGDEVAEFWKQFNALSA